MDLVRASLVLLRNGRKMQSCCFSSQHPAEVPLADLSSRATLASQHRTGAENDSLWTRETE